MSVEPHWLSTREWWKAVGIGVATAAILAVLNVIAMKTQFSPLPKPLGLAFAETVFGHSLPLPVGLLFHLAWVTFFPLTFVVFWRNALTLQHAIILAAVLWLLVLLVFFPVVGWGFPGPCGQSQVDRPGDGFAFTVRGDLVGPVSSRLWATARTGAFTAAGTDSLT